MIYTGYLAKWRTYPDTDIKIRIARPHILSPSKELLSDWKNEHISWVEYEDRFVEEITSNPDAVNEIKRLAELSRTKDVRLICYEKSPENCHRRVLFYIISLLRTINLEE